MVQLVLEPLSNVAISEDPGAVVLLAPPLVVDQLALFVKLPSAAPIQYLVAAKADGDATSKIAKTDKIPIFLIVAQLTLPNISKICTRDFRHVL